MKNGTTLEDFVKNYVKNKSYSASDDEYRRWLKEYGVDSDKIYAESIKDITGDYKRARSEYGSLAESLSSLGLTASGYSDYLNSKAYAEMQRRKEGAINKYAENERSNHKGYSEYLSNLAKAELESYEKVLKEITDSGISNYDDAYALAIERGLSGSYAERAAKSASDSAKRKARENALKTIISKGYGRSQALAYSLALGLSEDEAKELSEYAYKINRESYYSSDYIDYLKEKWAAESGTK